MTLGDQTHLAVYRYVYGLTGGPQQEVEDITAETYLKAWHARRRFSGNEDAATGWLLQIARRLVIDSYRRRQARPTDTDIDAALKFKYKPRVVDGQAIEVPGVQNKFTYELEQ